MTPVDFQDGRVKLYQGDCRETVAGLPAASVDAVVTDPPYELKFMGRAWDGTGVAFDPVTWAAILRVLKPGGHLVAFGGTRTFHRLACAIEDGGFEVRDAIMWHYGSGFPKSHNVALALDRINGSDPRGKAFNMKGRGDRAEELDANGREFLPPYEPKTDEAARWQGWGTALKPATEIICLARKPLIGTVADNVLAHGTGAINIDACRVGTSKRIPGSLSTSPNRVWGDGQGGYGLRDGTESGHNPNIGRWPANLIHDGSDEVRAGFPETGPSADSRSRSPDGPAQSTWSLGRTGGTQVGHGDSGSAARFFYTAKADSDDRIGSRHPTVKPVDLMRWLCRLITPPGGTILDPFAGTGTTAEAAYYEGFSAILCEREAEYIADIERRMRLVMSGPDERARESIKARMADKPVDHGPLFAVDTAKEYTAALAACRERGIMDPWAGK